MKLYLRIVAFSLVFMATSAVGAAIETAEILDHRTVTLAAPAPDPDFTLALDVFGRALSLHLEDNQAPFAALDARGRADIFAGGNRFLKGVVAGVEGSWVRLSWIAGQWTGGIFDGRELFLLDSARAVADLLTRAQPDDAELVLYRLSDLYLPGLTLAQPVLPAETRAGSGRHPEGVIQGANEALPVTIVSDTQFTAAHGGNTRAVTAGRINFVDGIYRSEVAVGIELHHHRILSNDGPLTSTNPNTLLEKQFRPYMTSGAGSGIPRPGVAHLFTGRNLDGAAGIAYVGALCNPQPAFGIDQNFSSEPISGLIFAHELGHNFGAPHDSAPPPEGIDSCEHEAGGRIMEPTVSTSTLHEFSDCSLQRMQPHIAGAACLVERVIFRDRFEP